MVFPADGYTNVIFQKTPPIKHHRLNFVNLHLMRWVRPENVRLLRDFRMPEG